MKLEVGWRWGGGGGGGVGGGGAGVGGGGGDTWRDGQTGCPAPCSASPGEEGGGRLMEGGWREGWKEDDEEELSGSFWTTRTSLNHLKR